MGDFIIKIHAVGGHGCERQAKAGQMFTGCGRMDCVDCYAALLVKQFADRFPGTIQSATETHWPVELNAMGRSYKEGSEVVDDLYYLPDNLKKFPQYLNPAQRKRIKGSFGNS